ncbi:MAG TPA: cation:proton antiporter [Pyrinomonadaceae bacterium]|nr:cation:proton antiporter [Pyrinomonadaceae bacterium]
MIGFGSDAFIASLAIIGIVIVVSALLSGFIERSGLPQVAVFLAIGAALGPAGVGVVDIGLQSPSLHVVATLSLTLVLFTDAVALNVSEVRKHWTLAVRLLGPGTLLSAALVAFAGWWLLRLPVPAAAILGAALASTDPVLLRGLLRRKDIASNTRQALQLESGLNDVVLLPVVIVAMAFMGERAPGDGAAWAKLGLNLFILGPGAGVAVGLVAVAALDLIRKKIGVRRDYESLYSLGIAFSAYAAAEAVHGSGFLAAFAAGLTIAALDVELCDCFLEYGAVTAEMMLLFTFVLFGSSLIWTGFSVISVATLIFAAFVILIRPPVYLLSLLGSTVDRRGRFLIAWFGPRGLSSLLLILLPIFAGLPGAEQLFPICSLVVLLSVVLHGGSPLVLAQVDRRRARHETAAANLSDNSGPAQPASCVEGSAPDCVTGIESAQTPTAEVESFTVGRHSLTLEEVKRLQQSEQQVFILDVRTERSLDDRQAQSAIRVPPDEAVSVVRRLGLLKEAWLIAYCA